jgi:serine/threonine protein kinase
MYNNKNIQKYDNNINKNNTMSSNYPNTIMNNNGKLYKQHNVEDKYRATLFSQFLKHLKEKYFLHGVSIEFIASGGGGWVYRVVISDAYGTVVGVDSSLKANKQRFYDFMTKTMKRNVPRTGAHMLPNEFVLKLQVTTTQRDLNIIKNVEKSQVREDYMNYILSHSPISKKYVPTFYMGGTYTWQRYILRISCMELIKGYQLEALLQSNWSLPKQIIPLLERACMSLWSQGFVHGDFHGGNILVRLEPSLKVYLIDYGQTERYNNTKPSNVSKMRQLVRRLENHV